MRKKLLLLGLLVAATLNGSVAGAATLSTASAAKSSVANAESGCWIIVFSGTIIIIC